MRTSHWILALVTVPAVVAAGLYYFKPKWIGPRAMGGPVAVIVDTGQQVPNRAYLGIVADKNPLGSGLLIQIVRPGSPAARNGIEAGEVLLTIDGTALTDRNDLLDMVLSKQPGDALQLEVERGDERKIVTVVLEDLHSHLYQSAPMPQPSNER